MEQLTVSPPPASSRGPGMAPLLLAVSLIIAGCVFFYDAQSAEVSDSEKTQTDGCVSAEECFTAAVWPKERVGHALTRDQAAAIKLERLRRVMERFPDSLWAKRAGLRTGGLLIDRNPAEALAHLRAVQGDFPVLDDYIRLWIGDALLHLGDAKRRRRHSNRYRNQSPIQICSIRWLSVRGRPGTKPPAAQKPWPG